MSTIGQIAINNGFTILVDAIQFIDDNSDAELLSAVTSPGDLTVFAPTNAAFGQLAADLGFTGDVTDTAAVTTFLVTNVDVATLRAVVEYHVLPEGQTAAELTSAGTFGTLQGATITIDGPTLVDNEPDLINPSLLQTDIPADNGVVHVIDKVLLPIDLPGNDAPTITGIVLTSGESGFDTNNDDFDILRDAVIAADLAGALADEHADLTVFAPNDAAFINVAQTLGFPGSDEAGAFTYIVDALRLLSQGGDPIPLLETILLYHVSGESLQATQVLSGDPITTLAGPSIQPDGTELQDLDPDLPNPNLIATDIQAGNGVVHVIDSVLIPADILPSDGSNDVDFVIGTDVGERTFLGDDNDFIDGKGGRDAINAGAGDDVVLGGTGNDFIRGNMGDDLILGEGGRDFVRAGFGDDTLDGGALADTLNGEGGNDLIMGGLGNDRLIGAGGFDTLDGGLGDDRLFGRLNADEMSGGGGDDVMRGGHGQDVIMGDDGADMIFGEAGHDLLIGGAGNDTLHGGFNADTFLFAAGDGTDTIADFELNRDSIDLTAFNFTSYSQIEALIGGDMANAEITLEGTTILLQGVGNDQLTEDHFIF